MAQVQALVWWPCAGSVAGGGLVVSLAAETGFVLSIDTSANLGGGGGKLVSSRLAGGKLVSSMSALDVVGGDAAVAGRGCPSTSSAAGAGPRCCDHWPRMPKTSTSIQSPRLSQGEYLVYIGGECCPTETNNTAKKAGGSRPAETGLARAVSGERGNFGLKSIPRPVSELVETHASFRLSGWCPTVRIPTSLVP